MGNEKAPKCPNGCEAVLRPIISDDPGVDRFQCGNIDCMRNFSVPKPGFGPSPLTRAEAFEKAEATVMKAAKQDKALKCGKCGKPYAHQARLETHEESCDGKKPRGVTVRLVKATSKPVVFTGTLSNKPSSITSGMVEILNDKRTQRIAELTAGDEQLQEIDRVIAKLEG